MPRTKTKATFIEPMLLLRTERLPQGPDWFYEIKLDGYRALAIKSGGKVQLRSRNDNDFTERYSLIAIALRAMPDETVLDGEVTALDEEGRPSFNLLQNYGSSKAPLVFFVFDVLMLEGRNVMAEPLMSRRALLGDPAATNGKVILGHLGNGASLAAVRNGKSVDTSMSFTPTAGVPMSTRSGDLDPGLVWYLSRTEKMSAKQFNEMVNFHSGLLGVSETSSDMRDLLDREAQDVRAAEAVALFCYQVKKWIGAFTAALGGLDTLVFAGGIGENAPAVRARICDGLGFLGIELEAEHNAANEDVISAAASRVSVRVVRTDEERMIAKTVCRVLGLG